MIFITPPPLKSRPLMKKIISKKIIESQTAPPPIKIEKKTFKGSDWPPQKIRVLGFPYVLKMLKYLELPLSRSRYLELFQGGGGGGEV